MKNEIKLITRKHDKQIYLKNPYDYKDIIYGIINEEIEIIDYDKKNSILYFKAPCEIKEVEYKMTGCYFLGEELYFYQEYVNFNCFLYDIARKTRDIITRYLDRKFNDIVDKTYRNKQ